MNVEAAEAVLAYTYAWWLTGSDHAARTAVIAAIDHPDVPGADSQLHMEILLRRVRSAAVASPTMCPASELALLHDAIGVGLDSAAGLVMIDAREARTELAHGRLEALGPESRYEITHPERMGGLAVGNPADVAAARQNKDLQALREMIMTGRDELVELARVDVPVELLDTIARRRTPVPHEHDVAEPDDKATAPDPLVDEGGSEVSGRRNRWLWSLVGVIALALVVAALAIASPSGEVQPTPTSTATDPVSGSDPVVESGTGASPSDDPTVSPGGPSIAPSPPGAATGQPTEDVTEESFVISRAGVTVGIGNDPDFDNPGSGPFDPVAITVEYSGAQDDDALIADWTVDDQPFASERADLSPLLTTSRFTKQVPEDGWPVGQHLLTFTLERTGEIVGTARFVVVADPGQSG
ncbi:MAG: hypothetical protein ACR2HR_17030 [Euzebya sp.]